MSNEGYDSEEDKKILGDDPLSKDPDVFLLSNIVEEETGIELPFCGDVSSGQECETAPDTDSYDSTDVLELLINPGGADENKERSNNDNETKAGMDHGQSSFCASVFNLVNNVAGAGILALSSGMAGGTGMVPAIVICCLLGAVSAHTFILIGLSCEMLQEEDFKGLWKRTIGPNTTYWVDVAIAVLCLAVAVIYSQILGDVSTTLLTLTGWPDQYNSRTANIIFITCSWLLPMSLVKNLSSLAFTSVLGSAAIVYTVFFIVVRALDGSYKLESGRFVTSETAALLPHMPAFEKASLWNVDFTSLVLASNLGLAYVVHYNGPIFYRDLKDGNGAKFSLLVRLGFLILVILYGITMLAGYSTFGDVSQGNLLLNYHSQDSLATFGRLATGCSLLFGFPLIATGVREGLAGAAHSFGYPQVGEPQNHFCLVACPLVFVTAVACTVKDVSLVVGLSGAVLGSFLAYICPSLIYSEAVRLSEGADSTKAARARWNVIILVPVGVFLGALGVYMTIKNSF